MSPVQTVSYVAGPYRGGFAIPGEGFAIMAEGSPGMANLESTSPGRFHLAPPLGPPE